MHKKLTGDQVSIPQFSFTFPKKGKNQGILTLFDLSSHNRAREALNFGLEIQEAEFNIFVIGEDRTGRLSGTIHYIERFQKTLPPVQDWVYLYNFDSPQEPLPFAFPTGKAKEFSQCLCRFMHSFVQALIKNFNTEDFLKRLGDMRKSVEETIQGQLEELRTYALSQGIDILRNPDGSLSASPVAAPAMMSHGQEASRVAQKDSASERDSVSQNVSPSEKPSVSEKVSLEAWNEVRERLYTLSIHAETEAEKLSEHIEHLKQNEAEMLLNPLRQKHLDRFKDVPGIQKWLEALFKDVLENLRAFVTQEEHEDPSEENILQRYTVNVFVQAPKNGPPLIVESNPTYENLFGCITYTPSQNGYITDFSMISSGSLHRANGGVLILRADALAMNPESWKYLKYALRDGVIRIEELHRTHTAPLSEAPRPQSIPLNLKVVIIGSPVWFYTYFYQDQDFKTYFKIKAEITPYFEANAQNLSTIGKMIRDQTFSMTGLRLSKKTLGYILGYSSRMAEHRHNLSCRLEILMDIICEAETIARRKGKKTSLTVDHIKKSIAMRQKRDSSLQEQHLEMIQEDVLKISTDGEKIGQINGLTVQEMGGYAFGLPTRISAQTSIGRHGVVNIEHMVKMSGAIQHKGVLILEGFLRGTFAQKFPLRCDCSITFEQTYVGVEGDSASAAELCAILSSLSRIPLRQNLAMTGAINQFGDILAVGGLNEKIEGFYEICKYQGITGHKGVIIPHSNTVNVILNPEVSEAVQKGTFHVWSVGHITEALDLLAQGGSKKVFQETQKTLERFHKILQKSPSS